VRSFNHCCSKKVTYITYSKSVFVALGIQHAMHMRHIVICGLLASTVFHIISNGARLAQRVTERKIFVLNFAQLLSKIFVILKKTERDMSRNVSMSSCKHVAIVVRFQWNLNFLNRFSKSTHIRNFTKILPVGAEMFHEDRRTYTYTAKVLEAFSQFCQSP